jgi:hypothetical protein
MARTGRRLFTSSPLTTANGGTVTETIDGSFVYVLQLVL